MHRLPTGPCLAKNRSFLAMYSFWLGRTPFSGTPQVEFLPVPLMRIGSHAHKSMARGLGHQADLTLVLTQRSWLALWGRAEAHSWTQNSVEAPEPNSVSIGLTKGEKWLWGLPPPALATVGANAGEVLCPAQCCGAEPRLGHLRHKI